MKKPVQKRSKAQQAASQKWAAAGRAKQAAVRAKYRAAHHGAGPPQSKAQQAATKKWQRAGVAAQAARRQGKTPAKPKPRAAVMPQEFALYQSASWVTGCNELMPTCSATAVANHLFAAMDYEAAEFEVYGLHRKAGGDEGATIESVLEAVSCYGLGPYKLRRFFRTDQDVIICGLVVGINLPHGRHAVLSHPAGMVTWGQVVPWEGEPEEAWALEWEA